MQDYITDACTCDVYSVNPIVNDVTLTASLVTLEFVKHSP